MMQNFQRMRHSNLVAWIDTLLAPLVGAFVGFVAAVATLGVDVVFGRVGTIRAVSGDSGTTLVGMRYFLAEGWQWPFLKVSGLNAPDGVPIAFTDSIPLWSLIAKIASPLGLAAETWFGLWFLAVYLLQGVFAVLALRAWGARTWPTYIAGATIAVSMPFFIFRVFHPALTGHFIILAAWAVAGHLRTASVEDPKTRWQVAAIVVVLAGLLIHPYFIVMTSAVVVGAMGDLVLRRKLAWSVGARWLAGLGSAFAAIAYGGGYLTSGAGSTSGYTAYGLLAVGPVVPQNSVVWPGDDQVIAVNNSLESYAWLGFGLVAAAAVAGVLAMTRRGQAVEVLRRHQLLLLSMIFVLGFAVTPIVHLTAGTSFSLMDGKLGFIPVTPVGLVVGLAVAALFVHGSVRGATWSKKWPSLVVSAAVLLVLGVGLLLMPETLRSAAGQFRASGRMFWTLGYGILIAALVLIESWPRKTSAAAVVLVLALVQVVDVGDVRSGALASFSPDSARSAEVNAFAAIIGVHDSATMPDPMACLEPPNILHYQNILTAASFTASQIDAVDEPRINTRERVTCPDSQQVELAEGVVGFYFNGVEANSPDVDTSSICRQTGSITVCTARWDQVEVAALPPELRIA